MEDRVIPARMVRATGPVAALAAGALCLAVARPLVAQAVTDSSRTARTGLIPAGYGSLRRDDIALVVQTLGLNVTALPLDESVIRTLAPDSYHMLHALRESKARQLDSVRTRMGLPSVQAWYVSFFNLQVGEARFDPTDFQVQSAGRIFRPLQTFALTAGFGSGRLATHATQGAIYAFDPGVDLTQPLTVTIGTQQNTSWGDALQLIEQERSLVWSRAAGKP